MVAHTCHPSTWRLRQEDCCEFKATLGYTARGQTRKHTKSLFKNEFMRHIKEVSSIPFSVSLAWSHNKKRQRRGSSSLFFPPIYPSWVVPTAQKAALSSQSDQMDQLLQATCDGVKTQAEPHVVPATQTLPQRHELSRPHPLASGLPWKHPEFPSSSSITPSKATTIWSPVGCSVYFRANEDAFPQFRTACTFHITRIPPSRAGLKSNFEI